MEKSIIILGVAQFVNILVMRYVGKSFITQPDWNVPAIFRNPFIGKLLVIGPQIALVALIILAFVFTSSPWWFAGASVLAFIIIASPPYGS